ncbi:uncharacterized protein LOC142237195 [Haematobia irritans]|uniref:uncharacterized protein LOC142237195 n=1 Tax=Haematobia irritans TaxID=7368 RepID=UPI003F50BCB1
MDNKEKSKENIKEDIEVNLEENQLYSSQISKEDVKAIDEIKSDSECKNQILNPDYITQSIIDRYIGSKENLSAEELRILLRDSRDSVLRQCTDQFDNSYAPSFSQLKSPYPLICRERYRLAKKMYEHQIHQEIQKIINQQSNAFDAICFVRVMAITSLWPPLHTRRNVDHTHQHYFQLSPKQKKRLQYIMQVDWSKT